MNDVVVFRQERERPECQEALYKELKKGRLRQGWSYRAGWDLHIGKQMWMKLYRAQRDGGDKRGTPKSTYEKIAGMLKINPGCLIVVPNQPDNDHFQLVRAVLSRDADEFPCYTYARSVLSDFRHCISIDKDARIERPYFKVSKYLSESLTSGYYRAPVQFIRDPKRAKAFREYFLNALSKEQLDAPPSPVQSPTVVQVPSLSDFAPKADGDYTVRIKGGKRTQSRKHETLVDAAGRFLRKYCNMEVHTHHPMDLFASKPQEIIFEAKIYSDRSPACVREAVGQLFWYRYSLGFPDAALCVLLDVRPSDKIIAFIEQGMHIHIAWMDGGQLIGGPESAPVLGLEGP